MKIHFHTSCLRIDAVVLFVCLALGATGIPSPIFAETGPGVPLFDFSFEKSDYQENKGTVQGLAEVVPFQGLVPVNVREAGRSGLLFPATKASPKQGPFLNLPNSGDQLRLAGVSDCMTISVWVKVDRLDDDTREHNRGIVGNSAPGDRSGWSLAISPEGRLVYFYVTLAADGTTPVENVRFSRDLLPPNEWVHVAVTFEVADKEGLHFYINDEPVPTWYHNEIFPFKGAAPLIANENPICVGVFRGTYGPINGAISGLKMFDRCLDASEVAGLESSQQN